MRFTFEPCNPEIPKGYYNIIDSGCFCIAEASREHAEGIVQALNRDELFEEMAEYIRLRAEEERTEYVCNHTSREKMATVLLAKIDALKQKG